MTLREKSVVARNHRITLAELARLSQLSGGGLIAHGTAIAPPPAHDPARVENHPLPAWNTPSFHAHAADLSVDRETGEITIHRYVVAQDVGFALNPTYIEGQIEGGVAQGLGQTLSEEIVYREGRVLNANLTDYKMPTALDVPPIESILVECPSRSRSMRRQGRRRAALHRAAGDGGQCHRRGNRLLDHLAADHGRKGCPRPPRRARRCRSEQTESVAGAVRAGTSSDLA